MVQQYVEKIVEVKQEPVAGQPVAAFTYDIGEVKPKGRLTKQTIKQIVKLLDNNPDKKIRIDSYADKETGSEKRNMSLAKQRIKYLRDIMVDDYSISEDRIKEKPYGSSVQLFNAQQSSQNRITWIFMFDD